MTLVSVIMPARNAAPTIAESIGSVLASVAVGELIVVDDRSRDNTPDIVGAIGDPRLRLIRGEGRGISAALNMGLAAARGEFIARCDADDLYPQDRFDWQLPILRERPDLAAVSGGFRTITDRGSAIADLACELPPQDITDALRRGISSSHFCAWLTRRSAIVATGGAREWFTTAEDLDLMFRIADQGAVWHEPRVAYLYRLHDNSIVHTQANEVRRFFEESARAFAAARTRTGQDDLSQGIPPIVPCSDGPGMSARQQALGMLIGSAWAAHRRGDRPTAARAGLKAVMLAPLSAYCWKQFALLLIKRSPKPS